MSTSPARRSLPATTDASPDLDRARSVFDKLQQRYDSYYSRYLKEGDRLVKLQQHLEGRA